MKTTRTYFLIALVTWALAFFIIWYFAIVEAEPALLGVPDAGVVLTPDIEGCG